MPGSRLIEDGLVVEVSTGEARGYRYRVVDVDEERGRPPTLEEATEAGKHAPFEPPGTARTRLRRLAEANAEAKSAG